MSNDSPRVDTMILRDNEGNIVASIHFEHTDMLGDDDKVIPNSSNIEITVNTVRGYEYDQYKHGISIYPKSSRRDF